ncbi:MAG: head GIN domain-containing protein [Anaerolineaceae bacterium]
MNGFAFPLLVISGLILCGCSFNATDFTSRVIRGSGKEASESRNISDFDSIALNIIGDITLEQGSEEGITITADDNVLPEIKTEVRQHRLIIETVHLNTSFRDTLPIRYTIRVKDLRAVTINGLGSVTAAKIQTERLNLTIAGKGNISVDTLETPNLTVTIPGDGEISAKGSAETQEYSIDGKGTLNVGDLQGERVSLQINGAGSGTLWAEESFHVIINGMGNLSYYGDASLTQTIHGMGSIKQLGAH